MSSYSHPPEYKNKKTPIETPSTSNAGSQKYRLEDNRPLTVAQRKVQVNAGSQSSPIQMRTSNAGLPDDLKLGIENL